MRVNRSFLLALVFTVVLHVVALSFGIYHQGHRPQETPASVPDMPLTILLPAPERQLKRPTQVKMAEPAPHALATRESPSQAPASMDAPAPPTEEEWTLAAKYTLKNSKRYRYSWGQQVRSMMGTAVEGPDQGIVRFRVEIAPDGRLAKLETLWRTSPVAEKLAREAIERMPPLPPTPTGMPLIFEKTISFQPFDSGWPPIYKYDCRPDPPKFRNPFVWDGKSPPGASRTAEEQESRDSASMEECQKYLSEDTLEAQSADVERQLKQWGSSQLDQRP